MALTIKDVANRCKVSTATVSRALRGLPNVTPSTREHVIKVAQEMGYSIDPVASQLRSGKSMNIGIVMPLTDNWFYSKLSTTAEAILINAGYEVVRYSMVSMGGQTAFFKRLAARKHLNGLIITTLTLSTEDISVLSNLNIPVVTLETQTDVFPSITTDNASAAQSATSYLLNLGHNHIGVIAGLEDDPFNFSVPQKRLQGYQDALKAYGLKFRPELVVSGNFSLAGGAEAMIRLLSIPSPPTAVFALSDEMAIGAMKTIREMNLKIPEDVSVIGFDDHEIAAYVGLTTVKQPVTELGEKAASLLLEHIDNKNKDGQPQIKMKNRLVVRSTTAPKIVTPLEASRRMSDQ
jgi:LacI family transcriptional regulator, repressor for deo operon, udp, cdd, tsx, nupC, and nupG